VGAMVKFGDDPAISLVEEAICVKVYRRTDGRTDRRTDGRRTPRDCISSWNELKINTNTKASILVSNNDNLAEMLFVCFV